MSTTGFGARRTIIGNGDIVNFDSATLHRVDSMAGEGLVGTDTTLQYDSGLIYNKTEVDLFITDLDTAKYDSPVVDAFIDDLDTAKYDSTTVDILLNDLDTAKYDSTTVDT